MVLKDQVRPQLIFRYRFASANVESERRRNVSSFAFKHVTNIYLWRSLSRSKCVSPRRIVDQGSPTQLVEAVGVGPPHAPLIGNDGPSADSHSESSFIRRRFLGTTYRHVCPFSSGPIAVNGPANEVK